MAHIPKRATQHGMFVPAAETAPPTLKPGQTELHRRGLYSTEAKSAFAFATYLSLDLPAKSEYTNTYASATVPENYSFQRARDRSGDVKPLDPCACHLTSHWRTVYQAAASQSGEAAPEQRALARPAIRAPPMQVASVGWPEECTAYQCDFGRYPSNPRDLIQPQDAKLPAAKTPLVAGTTKGTKHIPGYQGYLPTNPKGPDSARIACGEATRSVDKTNIAENYHSNLVGYAGHAPQSFKNDFGGRQPTSLTTHGRDYTPLRTGRLL